MTEEKGIDLADTVFVRDIDSRVFQSIAVKSLDQIEGVAVVGGTLIDNLLGRESADRIKGIYVEQDLNNQSVSLKIEVHIAFGLSIPEKSEEIQEKVAKDVSALTGLHVSCVHVIFKGIIPDKKELEEQPPEGEEEELDSWGLEDDAFDTETSSVES